MVCIAMKRKLLFVGIVLFSTSLSFADTVPKGIQTRYGTLQKTITALNFKAFSDFFAPEFVSVDPSGKSVKRDEFLSQIKPLFDGAKKAAPLEKLLSSTTRNGVVDVKFDFVLKLTGKKEITTVHEVGTDSWKLVGHKWLLVKTVDTVFDVKTTKLTKID